MVISGQFKLKIRYEDDHKKQLPPTISKA